MKLPSKQAFGNSAPHVEDSLLGLDITLDWLPEHPKIDTFLGSQDWGIYISEPYKQRPTLTILRIVGVTAPGSACVRLALIVTSGMALQRLKNEYDLAVTSQEMAVYCSAQEHIFGVLLLALRFIISDIIAYIAGSVELVHGVVRFPRRRAMSRCGISYADVSSGHGVTKRSIAI